MLDSGVDAVRRGCVDVDVVSGDVLGDVDEVRVDGCRGGERVGVVPDDEGEHDDVREDGRAELMGKVLRREAGELEGVVVGERVHVKIRLEEVLELRLVCGQRRGAAFPFPAL